MKIYTKSGDKGNTSTSIIGGERIKNLTLAFVLTVALMK